MKSSKSSNLKARRHSDGSFEEITHAQRLTGGKTVQLTKRQQMRRGPTTGTAGTADGDSFTGQHNRHQKPLSLRRPGCGREPTNLRVRQVVRLCF